MAAAQLSQIKARIKGYFKIRIPGRSGGLGLF
jgi:hypothetical protein